MKNFMVMGLVAMVFMMAVAMPTALGATNITSCSGSSIGGDVYEIQNDLYAGSLGSACFDITDDTVVEGNGYTIYHTGNGVHVDYNDNITVRNLNIVRNGTGIGPLYAYDLLIRDGATNVLVENINISTENSSFPDLGDDRVSHIGIGACCDWSGASNTDNVVVRNVVVLNSSDNFPVLTVGNYSRNASLSNFTMNANYTPIYVVGARNVYFDGFDINATERGISLLNSTNLSFHDIDYLANGYGSGGDTLKESGILSNNVSGLSVDGFVFNQTNMTHSYNGMRLCVGGADCDNYTLENIIITNNGSVHEALRAGWDNYLTNWSVSNMTVYAHVRGIQFVNTTNLNINDYTVRRQGNAGGDGISLWNVTDSVLQNLVLDGGETNWTSGRAIYVFLGNNITIGDVEAFDWNDGILFNNVLVGWIDNAEIYDIAITESRGYAVSLWETEAVLLSDIVSNRTACDAFSFGGIARTTDDVIAGGLEAYDIINDVCGGFAFLGADNITISNSKVGNATAVMALTDFFNDTNTNITIEAGEYYDYDQPTSISGNISNVVFNVSVWDTYTGCDVNDGDNIGNTPFEVNGSYSLSDTYPITLCFTNYTDFNDSSTNLSAESDLSNVTDLTLATLDTVVEWSGSGLDVKNKSLNTLVNLSSNYAEVNSTELPTLNTTANITFYGVSYSDTDHYRVLRDGSVCSDCTKLSADPVKFTVTGFSNFTTESYTPTGEQTAMEQQPLLVVVPIAIIGALLLGFIGSFASGLFSIKQMITYAVIVFVALAFIGVMYLL